MPGGAVPVVPSRSSVRLARVLSRTVRPVADRMAADGYALRATRGLLDAIAPPVRTGTVLHSQPVGGVPALWVSPAGVDAGRGVILYLHGGGYVFGSPRMYRSLVARLAAHAGVQGVIPAYRLAPEHPYPAALHDAKAAYRALLESGWPAERVILAGDSAGGHLAASLLADIADEAADEAADEGANEGALPHPAAAVLLSPLIDFSCRNMVNLDRAVRDPFLSPRYAKRCTLAYAGDGDLADPRIAVCDADKAGWPPVLIQVGGTECMCEDAELMFRSFARDRCTLEVWPGQVHAFQIFPFLPEARAAVQRAGQWIRQLLPTGAQGLG